MAVGVVVEGSLARLFSDGGRIVGCGKPYALKRGSRDSGCLRHVKSHVISRNGLACFGPKPAIVYPGSLANSPRLPGLSGLACSPLSPFCGTFLGLTNSIPSPPLYTPTLSLLLPKPCREELSGRLPARRLLAEAGFRTLITLPVRHPTSRGPGLNRRRHTTPPVTWEIPP